MIAFIRGFWRLHGQTFVDFAMGMAVLIGASAAITVCLFVGHFWISGVSELIIQGLHPNNGYISQLLFSVWVHLVAFVAYIALLLTASVWRKDLVAALNNAVQGAVAFYRKCKAAG